MNTTRIARLLVANRGEIARRIFRTAHSMGIETVAVHSEPDAEAPFVGEATYSVELAGRTSAETYLDAAAVLEAARKAGADAVHPGYGFLSENPEFAQAVEDAGLTWIGPTPAQIRAMAMKVESKRLVEAAGVPLVPGAELPAGTSEAGLLSAAESVGYPLLVKASAGGGGKGMRIVESRGDVVEAVAAASREADSAFGDSTVFLERYLAGARHVEVQVFGDKSGNVVHLFERECSIQRRHQKIVEESPSPGTSGSTLDHMYAAAVAAARAIGYVGAGTVEFLVAGEGEDQEFFFLEMNTRLQVEHPVTEEVTGIDLVEWQIRVARGEDLPMAQSDISRRGHAIEVRLYAEDPSRGYLPNTGTIDHVGGRAAAGREDHRLPRVRVDSGVESGSAVSPYYDPMLAKITCWAESRSESAAVLEKYMRTFELVGVVTNRDSLAAILGDERFLAGGTTTDYLDRVPGVLSPRVPASVRRAHLAAAALGLMEMGRSLLPLRVPPVWRNVSGPPEICHLTYDECGEAHPVQVAYRAGRPGISVAIATSEQQIWAQEAIDCRVDSYAVVRDAPGASLRRGGQVALDIVVAGVRGRYEVSRFGASVMVAGPGWTTTMVNRSRSAEAASEATALGPSTPVPGTVTRVEVQVGDSVVAGQTLVVLEAMKMEHRIVADLDGVVAEVRVKPGASVDAHTVVVMLQPADS